VNRIQRNRRVNEELKHIPQGSDYQNMFRASYHNTRRHELGRNPTTIAKITLLRAIGIVREEKPDFLPEYDKEFFAVQSST
jgi:hypothetical protein